MSHFSLKIPAPSIGVPPFLIKNLPDEAGKHWYLTGDGLGSDAYYTLANIEGTDEEIKQEIIDNGAVIKTALDGVEKYLQFSNLNLLKIVFQTSVGSIRVEKVSP